MPTKAERCPELSAPKNRMRRNDPARRRCLQNASVRRPSLSFPLLLYAFEFDVIFCLVCTFLSLSRRIVLSLCFLHFLLLPDKLERSPVSNFRLSSFAAVLFWMSLVVISFLTVSRKCWFLLARDVLGEISPRDVGTPAFRDTIVKPVTIRFLVVFQILASHSSPVASPRFLLLVVRVLSLVSLSNEDATSNVPNLRFIRSLVWFTLPLTYYPPSPVAQFSYCLLIAVSPLGLVRAVRTFLSCCGAP